MAKSIPQVKIGNEIYDIKDKTAREHLIEMKEGNIPPTSPDNKLWIKGQDAEYLVPTYDEHNELKSAINSIISGTPVTFYSLNDFLSDLPNWSNYSASTFVISSNKATISYKGLTSRRQPFAYNAGEKLSFRFKIKVDSYNNSTQYGQTLHISTMGYDGQTHSKDIYVNSAGTEVTYNNKVYTIGDEIDVIIETGTTVPQTNSMIVAFNSDINNSAGTLTYSIVGFDVFITADEDDKVRVKYSDIANEALSVSDDAVQEIAQDSGLRDLECKLETGYPLPETLYSFNDFLTGFSSWNNLSSFTEGTDYTINENSVNIDAKINNINSYLGNTAITAGNHVELQVSIKVNEYTNTSQYGQTINITLLYLESSNIVKSIYVAKNNVITYNGESYAIEDQIDVIFDVPSSLSAVPRVAIQTNVNSNAGTIDFDIVDFKLLKIIDSEKYKVKYSQVADKMAKRYAGKTWAAVGDSLTATHFDLYVSYVSDALGLVATNYGVGSSDVTYVEGETIPSFVSRVCGTHGQSGYTDNFDLWTIFGGINDAVAGNPIGTINDSTDTTFYGALNLICQNLLTRTNHPTVALICTWNCKSITEAPYNAAIKAIGEKYGLPVLDLFMISGINSLNWDYYLRDSIHPSQNGANKLRPIILEWFEKLRLSEITPNMPN